MVHIGQMSREEKEKRVKELWLKVYNKAHGASILLNQLEALRTKIQIFGR